ncbi:MAG: hydrogenase expression/formation protein HypE [Longimicrobiales bacterium]|nr:hydrogenase expression/formation protein HypE [Longimicrobiales bacterium]
MSAPAALADRARTEPRAGEGCVRLGHGSGGKLSARLLRDHFLPRFKSPYLHELGDGAVVPVAAGSQVVSTDTFVVRPLEFPGGDIGRLAVHGTVNDVAMMGGVPRYLSAAFVLEEGLELEVLDRILDSMLASADACGIELIAGDTKVVERGKADGLYVNTTGFGTAQPDFRPAPRNARPGDAVIVSGPVACHGMAIMASREGLAFDADIASDTASLVPLVNGLREALGGDVHCLRDATRGGLASALNEIAAAAEVGVELTAMPPVPPAVEAACEMLGLDPLYVANEGVMVALVDGARGDRAVEVLRRHPVGARARVLGHVTDRHVGTVALRTGLGGTRVVDMLPGDQLPRIC